jgi:hypothetical protein
MQNTQSLTASGFDLYCGQSEFIELAIMNSIFVATCQQLTLMLFNNTQEGTDCSSVPANNLSEPLLCSLCHYNPIDGDFDRDYDTLGPSHRQFAFP